MACLLPICFFELDYTLSQLLVVINHSKVRNIDGAHIICVLMRMFREQHFNLSKGATRLAIKEVAELLEQRTPDILMLNAWTLLHNRCTVKQLVFLFGIPRQIVSIGVSFEVTA